MKNKGITKILEEFAKTYYSFSAGGRYFTEEEWVKREVRRFKTNNPKLF